MFEIVFSPTGGTQKVADRLCKELGGSREIIDLTDRKPKRPSREFSSQDLCLLAVPSYGGRVPAIAAERIRHLKGNQAKAILAVIIGNRAYDDTLLELKDIAEEAGFLPVAAIAANAEHSIMRQFGSGRPDREDEREFKAFADKIKKFLQDERFGKLQVPGNRPFTKYNGLPLNPKASKKCSKCGKCVSACPVGAIPKERPNKTDASKCITCMRCVSICPEKARALNKLMLGAAGIAMKKACSKRKKNELYLAE